MHTMWKQISLGSLKSLFPGKCLMASSIVKKLIRQYVRLLLEVIL